MNPDDTEPADDGLQIPLTSTEPAPDNDLTPLVNRGQPRDTLAPADSKEVEECLRLLGRSTSGSAETVLAEGVKSQANDTSGSDGGLTRFRRFTILRELGRGGFGIVFLAVDPNLGRKVALKLPRAETLITPEAKGRFLREARALAEFDHPNLLPVYEAGSIGPIGYIASAYCEGPTLSAWLKEHPGPVDDREAAAHVRALAEGIDHVHAHRVLHRDLKPSNILLQPNAALPAAVEKPSGGQSSSASHPSSHRTRKERTLSLFTPRITDFGLAKILDDVNDATASGLAMGTPAYMSPEQAAGRVREVGPGADVYALGVILYELLTSRKPFVGETNQETMRLVLSVEPVSPRRLRPKLPRDLETIVLKCMEKSPGRRYASARALAEDLDRFLDNRAILARPVPFWERAIKWSWRRPTAAALLAVTALAITLAVGLIAWSNTRLSVANDALRDQVDETGRALKSERQRKIEVDRLAANLAFHRAISYCQHDEIGRGLIYLADALQMAETAGDESLARTIRANIGAWRAEVAVLQTAVRHPTRVQAAAFSPDGRTALTGGYDGTLRLWDTSRGVAIGTPGAHTGEVKTAAFSRDGRAVLTGGFDKVARLWNAQSGEPLGPRLLHAGVVLSTDIGPDGKTVVTGTSEGTVHLWDGRTGQPLVPPLRHLRDVIAVRFSPDGQQLLTGSHDHTAQLWEVATGRKIGPPLPHDGPVLAVAISPDGKLGVTGSLDQKARLWDLVSGQPVGAAMAHQLQLTSVEFSPDGTTILTGSGDATARVWDARTGSPTGPVLRHAGWVPAAVFSPTGATILTASTDTKARLWESTSGRLLGAPLEHGGIVSAVAFGAQGKSVLTASHDDMIRLWTTPESDPPLVPLGSEPSLSPLVVRSDGELVLADEPDRSAAIYRVPGGERLAVGMPHGGNVMAGAFSADGSRILTAGSDGLVKMWDSATGTPIGAALVHPEASRCVAISKDGLRIATGCEDGFARIWDAKTRQPVGERMKHQGPVIAVAFSPDGTKLLTGSIDSTARLWDASTGKPLHPPWHHRGWVRAVAFHPDGQTALTASNDTTARLWVISTGEARGAPLEHGSVIVSATFSPDGRRIACGCEQGHARIWDTDTLKPVGPALDHPDGVLGIAFTPDSRSLVTGGQNPRGRIKKWIRKWSLAPPVKGDVQQVMRSMNGLTGLYLDHSGDVRLMAVEDWQKSREGVDRPTGTRAP